jgi:hypothetical protein
MPKKIKLLRPLKLPKPIQAQPVSAARQTTLAKNPNIPTVSASRTTDSLGRPLRIREGQDMKAAVGRSNTAVKKSIAREASSKPGITSTDRIEHSSRRARQTKELSLKAEGGRRKLANKLNVVRASSHELPKTTSTDLIKGSSRVSPDSKQASPERRSRLGEHREIRKGIAKTAKLQRKMLPGMNSTEFMEGVGGGKRARVTPNTPGKAARAKLGARNLAAKNAKSPTLLRPVGLPKTELQKKLVTIKPSPSIGQIAKSIGKSLLRVSPAALTFQLGLNELNANKKKVKLPDPRKIF